MGRHVLSEKNGRSVTVNVEEVPSDPSSYEQSRMYVAVSAADRNDSSTVRQLQGGAGRTLLVEALKNVSAALKKSGDRNLSALGDQLHPTMPQKTERGMYMKFDFPGDEKKREKIDEAVADLARGTGQGRS